MFFIQNRLRFFLLASSIAIGLHAPCAQAIFCTVRKYVHPESQNIRWLLGDVHCDIHPGGAITKLQQFALLKTAQQLNSLIIAENAPFGGYNPYLWTSLCSIDVLALYAMLKYQKDPLLRCLGSMFLGGLLGSHIGTWYTEWLGNQKPQFCIDEFLKELKKFPDTTCLNFFRYTPLQRLVEYAKLQGIDAIDIEFRYHTLLAGLSQQNVTPVQKLNFYYHYANHWITQKITRNRIKYQLSVTDYRSVNDTILKEIRSYNDGPILHEFYQDCIQKYQASYITKELYSLAQSNPTKLLGTVVPPIAQKYNVPYSLAYNNFVEHNKDLLDARVVHTMHQNSDRPNIFICTGAAHTDNIACALEKLGYYEQAAWGKDNLTVLTQAGIIGGAIMQVKDLDHFIVDLEQVFAQS